jgi:hypothetical protein
MGFQVKKNLSSDFPATVMLEIWVRSDDASSASTSDPSSNFFSKRLSSTPGSTKKHKGPVPWTLTKWVRRAGLTC